MELHLHLDCSLSYEVVQTLDPQITPVQYATDFVAGGKCHNLNDYLKKALAGIRLMQTEQQLKAVTKDLFSQLQADGIIYAELRFAPLQHLDGGLKADQVVEIVDSAIRAEILETGIEARMILCTLRHFDEQQSMNTVQLVEQFKGSTVTGFDIAADEAGFPLDEHLKAFKFAKAHQLGITAHAGEACGANSVWETINKLQPSRIGHGVRSIEDPELITWLRHHDIHLEICPTSNIQTHVFEGLEDHPINKFYEAGVSCGINTDGRAISAVSLSDEYEKLHRVFGWGKEQFRLCNLNAIKAAFIPDQVKDQLRDRIINNY